jgi:hypothetical protein
VVFRRLSGQPENMGGYIVLFVMPSSPSIADDLRAVL